MTLNKAMLIGRLGKDPEVRFTKSGQPVASFSMATDRTYKDAQGARQKETEWHNIVVFGKLADFVQNYLKKGREVYLEGRIQTRDWTDKENLKHYKTEIVAESIRFVGPRPEGASGPSGEDAGPPRSSKPRPANAVSEGPPPDDAYVEDDIPF
jgi:single-strand DNA-binding protein